MGTPKGMGLCQHRDAWRPKHHRCLSCHAAEMRAWRKGRPLTEVQRFKMNCRSYAHVYLRRGKLTRSPCARCGSADSQMHHADYSKPLDVTWMCRACHLAHHQRRATTP